MDADVHAELAALEPLFHSHPPGTTIDELAAMIAPDFSEVGASGTRYTREEILGVLERRLRDGPKPFPWPAQDFAVRELAPDLYLATYRLVERDRPTQRSSIWRRTPSGWQVVFHQGTEAPR
jgi:hypothetical protein